MFIFVVQTLQKKWNKIHMKQLASEKHMENDCFPRTLKFKMSQSPLRPGSHDNNESVTLIKYTCSTHVLK